MLYRILIIFSLFCFSKDLIAQDFKRANISSLLVRLDSLEKIITIDKWGVDSYLYAHYSLTNSSDDTIVFVSNSCPSLNTYSIEINDSLYIFNTDVRCSFNAFTYHRIAPEDSIRVSEPLEINSDVKFDDTQIVIFSIPLIQWDSGEIQVNGLSEESIKITFTGKTKFTTKHVDNKKKKNRLQLKKT